jgi:hypothetical protein
MPSFKFFVKPVGNSGVGQLTCANEVDDACANEINDICINKVNDAYVNEVDSEVNSDLDSIEINDYAAMRLRRGVGR